MKVSSSIIITFSLNSSSSFWALRRRSHCYCTIKIALHTQPDHYAHLPRLVSNPRIGYEPFVGFIFFSLCAHVSPKQGK